jgi:glycosyltransferase involved in cell wall biosynthesis
MSKVSFQVLVVTMKQRDFSLLKKMNIQSDALIGNQGMDSNSVETTMFNGHKITMYSWNEKGVGLNRNNLMMRSDADIILFADDDVVYDDGYVETVLEAFEQHPEADGITFDVVPIPDTINPDLNKKWHRIRWYNCLKYGAPRLALRTKTLREKNIYYSLLFGGGAKYSSGEDSLFIAACIKSGMKLYGCPQQIGHVTFETSSWYVGYNEKYFKDKGLFFYFLSPRFSKLLCIQYCLRRNSLFKEEYSAKEALKLMVMGIEEYRKGNY